MNDRRDRPVREVVIPEKLKNCEYVVDIRTDSGDPGHCGAALF